MELNNSQKEAVESKEKIILCLAGAGTGKTRTLTERIAHLNDMRISTNNMLALTFTRLAGFEMKERITKLVGETQGRKLFCNTFHAFCIKVINEYGKKIGYNENFTIYDQDDRDSIIKEIIKEYGYDCKLSDVIPILYENNKQVSMDIQSVIDEYFYLCIKDNAMDLDMILFKTYKLIASCTEVQEDLKKQYEYIFIDEFQDTNDIQFNIIKAINPKNLFVVGDDFQAIYGWRGAKVYYTINFNDYYPGAKVFKLQDNYRSTDKIISSANILISKNENQTEKILIPHKEGPKVQIIECKSEKNEALTIAMKTLGLNPRTAILARTNQQLENIAIEFKKQNIEFTLISNKDDVFKTRDIFQIFKIMQFAFNTKNDVLFKSIVNFPIKRIQPLDLMILEEKGIEEEKTLFELSKEKGKAKKFTDLIDILSKFNPKINNPHELFKTIYTGLELDEFYLSRKLQNKIDNLYTASEKIYKWEEKQQILGENSNINIFLKWLYIRDIQDKLIENKSDIQLMTIHASKGLEFENVFIAGLNEGSFPSRRGDLEEERRLMYVGMTRAKKNLFLSRPLTTIDPWNGAVKSPKASQFLEEIE